MRTKDPNRQRRLQEYKPFEATREERAMKYHEKVQKHWKEQAQRLAELTNRDPSTLSMFSDEKFRRVNEERALISQVVNILSTKDSGVWKPIPRIGDLFAQPEKPHPVTYEAIGDPTIMEDVPGSRPTDFFKSKYYKKRVKQLKSFLGKIKPHNPDFNGLIVVGQPIDLSQFENVNPPEDEHEEIPEEEITTENEESIQSVVRLSINKNRLFFTTEPGIAKSMFVDVKNTGTTAVYYKWEKAKDVTLLLGSGSSRVPIRKPVEDIDNFNWRDSESFIVAKGLKDPSPSEFSFVQRSGSILPGNSKRFEFAFKSNIAGCFTEKWIMRTTPTAETDLPLTVSLHGRCDVSAPNLSEFRATIDKSLHESERNRCVEEIISCIFDRIEKVVKGNSKTNEEQIDGDVLVDDRAPAFEEANSKWNLKYTPSLYESLFDLTERCFDILGITGFNRFWDMKVESISELIMKIDDGETKRELLQKLNEILREPQTEPPQTNLTYSLAYVQISSMLDEIPEIVNSCSNEYNQTIPEFMAPKEHKPNENDESNTPRHRARIKHRYTRRKGRDKEDPNANHGPQEMTPELRDTVKKAIVESLRKHLDTFDKLASESKGVTRQLTRVNEVERLETNLDLEVDDDI
ncbi:MYCBP-associated protein-like [Histomonas meleagridis]|uniref:MYCBP-associated protein-like n=1 Tax=Histomonas meleagridis TaxID=135588 RepID=UPI0035597CEE|nr:MYCBP-associated protein-like [Histomonas meleagridis]KAH0800067.1 MYCBP-associated protein-like [Histomonas meleagridis]